jgi:hypothetical protein
VTQEKLERLKIQVYRTLQLLVIFNNHVSSNISDSKPTSCQLLTGSWLFSLVVSNKDPAD